MWINMWHLHVQIFVGKLIFTQWGLMGALTLKGTEGMGMSDNHDPFYTSPCFFR